MDSPQQLATAWDSVAPALLPPPFVTQPEGEMGGAHRLFDGVQQAANQMMQVNLFAQGRAEGGEGTRRVVFVAIEALVNDKLDEACENA